MPGKPCNIIQFWQELKRRKVVRVITLYAAASFVILELVSIIIEPLRLPDWTLALVIVLLCIGFIITVILSWVYDITPQGIEKTKPVKEASKTLEPTGSLGWKITTYVSLTIILAFVIFYILNTKEQSVIHAEIGKSIAVLPFEDMSPQEDQEYFCDGITEELINSLTQVEELKVIARTSTFAFKGKQEDIREIGRKLDVETMLEGSVRKAGNRLRITAQLIKVEDGTHLWSQQFDRDLEDIFAIQDEISMAITDILKVKLLGNEKNLITKRQTDNIEAYNLYLRGRYFWNLRTEEDVMRSIHYYNQSIELDSTYALAYAGLADTYFVLAWWEWFPRNEGYNKAREYAHKALSLNNNIAEAHATLGGIAAWHEWKWEESIDEYQKAISLNPNYATAYQYYSETLDILGKNQEAREQINLALKLNPHSVVMYSVSAIYYYNSKNYEMALEESKKAREITYYDAIKIRLLKCYINLGMHDEALEHMKDIVSVDTSGNHNDFLDKLYQQSGMEGILNWFGNWVTGNVSNGNLSIASSNYRIASIFALAGNNSKAMELLKKGMESREGSMPRIHNNPDFNIVRDDPRFKAMLKEMRILN